LTNKFPKLKTTNRNGTKFDTACRISLSYSKFISEDAAALHFLKLFEFEFVRFFYSKVGLFKKAFRQIEAGGFGLKRVARWCRARKGYQSFQEHFVFEGFGSLFFVSE
jgi:hypothetical protein